MGGRSFFVIGAFCLSLTSCASLSPRNWHWPTSNPKKTKDQGDRIPPADPTGSPTAQRTAPNNTAATTGILAGQVIDGLDQRRAGTVILVSATDTPDAQPQEVLANDQGYFLIQGLQTGRRYKLLARLKQGDQLLSGTTIATPPNAVLLIKLGDDLATAEVPPIRPGKSPDSGKGPRATLGPVPNGEKNWSPNAAQDYLYQPDRGNGERIAPTTVGPQPGAGESNGARLGSPAPNGPQRQSSVPLRPELIAESGIAKNQPPPAAIESQNGNGLAAGTPVNSGNSSSGRSPLCTLTSDGVLDLALTDLNGRVFSLNELRGKVVLLDFWGTWCPHCIRGMPHFIDLQRRFGAQGLEVVGIAYEDDKLTQQQKIDKVNFVTLRQGVNYKILLGGGDNCPVLSKLEVQKFPTLVLLDETGRIVWRGEGLTAQNKARLEAEIRKRLRDG